MATKYKDYPVYTYDEPATYSDFSGGINTDPSNEHLLPNEMRDCLNMHYSSAALVKRKGASLLCNIECEDELFNVQGVFLFTYRVTYIIIAADGKLYKGFYSPNATIRLSRLPISVDVPDSDNVFNPLDTLSGLDIHFDEQLNQKHDGFICKYLYKNDEHVSLESETYNYIGEFIDLPDRYRFLNNDVVSYGKNYYIVTANQPSTLVKETITPASTYFWMDLNIYNYTYAEEIKNRTDILSITANKFDLILDLKTNIWRKTGYYSDGVWISNGQPGIWKEREDLWRIGEVVTYNDNIYVCIKQHYNHQNEQGTLKTPESLILGTDGYFTKLVEKHYLIFQNSSPIEAATYNNKLYITTGTRFICVELVANDLVAHTVEPYLCSTEEIKNIGYNYLSPYPQLCQSSRYDQVITSIGNVLAIKKYGGLYELTPQMNFAQGETEADYCFKWEKKIGAEWYTLYSFQDNYYPDVVYDWVKDPKGKYAYINDLYVLYEDSMGEVDRYKQLIDTVQQKRNLFTIEVDDADRYQYRVSFAKSFEQTIEHSESWDYNHGMYKEGDTVSISITETLTKTYKCVKSHNPKEVLWDDIDYKTTEDFIDHYKSGYYYKPFITNATGDYEPLTTPSFATYTTTRAGDALYKKSDTGDFEFFMHDISTIRTGETYWKEIYEEEKIIKTDGTEASDWTIHKIDGEYFGQGLSILAEELTPNDTFNIIHTCKKITSDGNKFLLYDDKYNSGSWYKTIIDNPAYITDRGSLSFKTNKNESLIKVIPFNGTLIAFANAEDVGGSIHMVTGNGDDWDDSSGYYSPYRRKTINATVSCNNADTVQVCENILVFKYFDMLYYISGSELNNEVVSVYSCNDKIKHNNNFVRIPWEDNDCISEVTEDYYALIWKEKYIIEDGDLILDRHALKIKMYYKLGTQQNGKIVYPWLRDESEYFNINHIVYIKGKPIYLYNNTLTTFHESNYTDFGKIYQCLVHFRGEDLNYPKMYKLISNILVYYHRNQYSKIDFDLTVKNEAGHILLDSSIKRVSLQDLRALKAGDKVTDGEVRLDSTILDSKVFNTAYKFPCLLSDAIITSNNDKEFSISSITYNYTTSDTPDTTSYDLYANILRPKEVK